MALLIFSLLGDAKINSRYVMSKEAMRGNFWHMHFQWQTLPM
jgi:hypothetical protein